MTVLAECTRCNKQTHHSHLHDTAYGIFETHMAGTERFECQKCMMTTYSHQNDGRFVFKIDGVKHE